MITRLSGNPIIGIEDVKPSRDDYEVVCAFNPAAVRYGHETILLLRIAERPKAKNDNERIAPIFDLESGTLRHIRVTTDDPDLEDSGDPRGFRYRGGNYLTSISHLRIARSNDGEHFSIEDRPALFPREPYETYGLEDPRITPIGGDYYIAYKAVSETGICTALAKTRDFKDFERLGVIFCPENLDVALFPEKIADTYWALTRPVPGFIGRRGIWLAASPDLLHWGRHQPLILPRPGLFDGAKTGASCIPIRTDEGWLEIYHGADDDDTYCLGFALLHPEDPRRVLGRCQAPLMTPEAAYETQGFYPNVIFACGAVVDDNGTITIYYGAADTVTAASRTSIDTLLNALV
ncbi:MAG: glycosidase [Chitinivibrionales bacterium]|nr:glycosidase [Chitinivibrionales bacterium]MBD3358467.1 glycosidase [Chitinivibrionales bacterium]